MVAITVAVMRDVIAVVIVSEEKMFVKKYCHVLFVTEIEIVIENATGIVIEIVTATGTVTEIVTGIVTVTENVAVTGIVIEIGEALRHHPGPETIFQAMIPVDVKKSSEYQMPVRKVSAFLHFLSNFLKNLHNIVEKF